MIMTRDSTDDLLLQVMGQQVDDGDTSDLDEARIEQALTSGPGFSEAESRELWRSPFTRSTLMEVKERLCRELRHRWQEEDRVPFAELRAAAAGDGVVTVQGKGFTLTIFPQDDTMAPWILSLEVDAEHCRELGAGLRFQLIDSGGMVWLTGRPNSRGEINDEWYDRSISPQDRLIKHHLSLIPV